MFMRPSQVRGAPFRILMSSGPPYTCSHCDETFQIPQAKATHVAQLSNKIEPITKLLAVRKLAAELGRPPTISEVSYHALKGVAFSVDSRSNR